MPIIQFDYEGRIGRSTYTLKITIKPSVRQKNWDLATEKMNEEFHDENSLPRLTIKELRSFKGFEIISDSECEEIINSLVKLAIITYNFKNAEI